MKPRISNLHIFIAILVLVASGVGVLYYFILFRDGGGGSSSPVTIFSPTTTTFPLPDTIPFGDGYTKLVAGSSFVCGLAASGGTPSGDTFSEGEVWCWGANQNGELGRGSRGNSDPIIDDYLPDPVAFLRDAADVTSGWHHACILTIQNEVKCWGDNSLEQTGIGRSDSGPAFITSPEELVAGLSELNVRQVAAGDIFTCALADGADNQGEVWCWGANRTLSGNLIGILPSTESEELSFTTPQLIPGLTDGAKMIVTGGVHACVVTNSDEVMCWGKNSEGQLGGSPSLEVQPTPGYVQQNIIIEFMQTTERLSGVTSITAGRGHVCVIAARGEVWCWGNNRRGQIGRPSTRVPFSPSPLRVGEFRNVVAIATSPSSEITCMITEIRSVRCWGLNSFNGENIFQPFGNQDRIDEPVGVAGLTDAIDLVVGRSFICIRDIRNEVKCVGVGDFKEFNPYPALP